MHRAKRAGRITIGLGGVVAVVLWCLMPTGLGGPGRALGYDPLTGDYSKDNPLDVRIMAYNHARNFIDDPSTDAAFDRILIAIDPDIISFEEFTSAVSESDVANRLNSILPIGGTGWQIHFGLMAGVRTVLASRYPLVLRRSDTVPASSTRGVTMALADLPDGDYSGDVYLMAVHLKCCGDPGGSEDAKRQDSADAMANWMGDARGVARPSGNFIALQANTPIIALGDFNLVGGPQPENTLMTGNIQDESTYGPDVKGDWDNTDLTNLNPLDPFTGDNFTWQGSTSFDPSPLDRMFITDSVFTVANSFILNTLTMTGSALTNAGLQSDDTAKNTTSDHLPIVMDLRMPTPGCINDGQCSDGAFCNGVETCVASVCQPGTAVNCDDGVDCTDDSCNEASDQCDNVGSDANCIDNGSFCDGLEVCDPLLDCVSNGDPCWPIYICNEVDNTCDPIPGDLNLDGSVNLADHQVLANCLGGPSVTVAPGTCTADEFLRSDLDQDGRVDAADYGWLQLLLGP